MMSHHRLVEKIQTDIERYALASTADKLIVGLSGGADSVALLTALDSLGYECVAAHCNFHLRGAESDRDQRHATDLCRTLGVEITVMHFDVEGYIEAQQKPQSVEMACRDLRYRWFESLLAETGAKAVAIAHNADDNIETQFLNLTRGTGLAGLRGMRPRNDRNVIRPMLHCSRAEIEEYLRETGLDYVVDSTNLKCDYRRNKLRNKVLPELYRQFPDAAKGILSTIDILSQTEEFYRTAIEALRAKYVDASGDYDIHSLCENEPHCRLLLYEWLHDKGFSAAQIDSIIDNRDQSGRRYPVGDTHYYIDRGTLRRFEQPCHEFLLDELYEINRHDAAEFTPRGDRWTIYVDGDAFDRLSLSIRSWREGDRIKPFGMRGTKKLSDVFSDSKIALATKERIPLLLLGDDIIWVTGLKSSRLYSVTSSSTSYVTIRYIGPPLF